MSGQSMVPTPIFDELLRELGRDRESAAAGPTGPTEPAEQRAATPRQHSTGTGRRRRAD